jgi:membrane protein insertase Oxa1/YidC/SpoIIIJ
MSCKPQKRDNAINYILLIIVSFIVMILTAAITVYYLGDLRL